MSVPQRPSWLKFFDVSSRVLGGAWISYTTLSLSLFPSLYTRNLVEIKDPIKLDEIKRVALKIGLRNEDLAKIKFFRGKRTMTVGCKYSMSGAGVIFHENLVPDLGSNVYPLDGVHLGSNRRPYKLQREVLIAHELSHYYLNHALLVFGTSCVGVALIYKLPYTIPRNPIHIGTLLLLCTGTLFFTRQRIIYQEIKADSHAIRCLGLDHAKVFAKECELRATYERTSSLRKVINYVAHVPWTTRLENALKLEKELQYRTALGLAS